MATRNWGRQLTVLFLVGSATVGCITSQTQRAPATLEMDGVSTIVELLPEAVTRTAERVPASSHVRTSSKAAVFSVPDIAFLGEGPAQYSLPDGYEFIVKRNKPFRFEYESGPAYSAVDGERVWSTREGTDVLELYDKEHNFGFVNHACQISYVQIDDDIDSRRNRFYIDRQEVHLMPQGMTVYGDFSTGRGGELTLFAEDSIAAAIEVVCPPPEPTPSPSATPTAKATETVTPTVTSTPDGATPTATTVTPTVTPPSSVTPTVWPPTPVAHGPAYTRFNFEMAGHSARDGYCYMHRDTGELLLVWQMQDGWTDSATHPLADEEGWIEVEIAHQSVYVEVFCDDGSGLTRMIIKNGITHPTTGKIVGWLTRGVRNSIEIAWP